MSDSVDDMQLPIDDPEFWRFVMTSLNVNAAQAPTALGQQYPAPSHRSPPIREPGSSVTRHPSQHQAGNFQPYGFLPPGPVFNHHGSAMGAPPQYLQTATPAHAPYEPLYSSSQHPSVAYSDPEGSIGMPWAQNASPTQPAGSTSGVSTWPTSNMISTGVVNPQTGPIPGGTGLQLPQHGSGYGGYGIGTPPPGQQYGPSAVQQPSRQVPSLAAVDTEGALQFYRDGEYADYSPTSDPDSRFSTTPSYMSSRSPETGTYSNIVDPAMSRPDQVTYANQANYIVSTERPRLSGMRLQATAPATTSGAAGPYHFPQDGRTAIPHSWAPHDVSQVDPLAIGVDIAKTSPIGKAPKMRKARAQPTASVAARKRRGESSQPSGCAPFQADLPSLAGPSQLNWSPEKGSEDDQIFQRCYAYNNKMGFPWTRGERFKFFPCGINRCEHPYDASSSPDAVQASIGQHVMAEHTPESCPPGRCGPRCKCPYPNCGDQGYAKHLRRHIYGTHVAPYIKQLFCKRCQQSFTRKGGYAAHMLKKHGVTV